MNNMESTQNYFKQEIDAIRIWIQILQEHLYVSNLDNSHTDQLIRQLYKEIDHLGKELNTLLNLINEKIDEDPFCEFLAK